MTSRTHPPCWMGIQTVTWTLALYFHRQKIIPPIPETECIAFDIHSNIFRFLGVPRFHYVAVNKSTVAIWTTPRKKYEEGVYNFRYFAPNALLVGMFQVEGNSNRVF